MTDDVHKPFISEDQRIPELTWFPIVMGALLGIIFGASSMYLVLKVGLTVSASIPVAVLSITLFRAISKVTGIRKTTILENNIVQTTGSAGESLAFAVGLIMPALLLLGGKILFHHLLHFRDIFLFCAAECIHLFHSERTHNEFRK
jgi:uncharacterized oligopeptide transporter (OPT) family protein